MMFLKNLIMYKNRGIRLIIICRSPGTLYHLSHFMLFTVSCCSFYKVFICIKHQDFDQWFRRNDTLNNVILCDIQLLINISFSWVALWTKYVEKVSVYVFKVSFPKSDNRTLLLSLRWPSVCVFWLYSLPGVYYCSSRKRWPVSQFKILPIMCCSGTNPMQKFATANQSRPPRLRSVSIVL